MDTSGEASYLDPRQEKELVRGLNVLRGESFHQITSTFTFDVLVRSSIQYLGEPAFVHQNHQH